MKTLNELEIQQISGGFGFGGFNTFFHSTPEFDKAVSRFSDAYLTYSEKSKTSGFNGGSVVGGAIGNAIGTHYGGKVGGVIGGIAGAYAGKMYDDGLPLSEYLDAKREAEKIYGLE